MATLVFFALHFLSAAAIVFHLSREIYSLTACEETVHYPRPTWCMRNTTNALNAARFCVSRAKVCSAFSHLGTSFCDCKLIRKIVQCCVKWQS